MQNGEQDDPICLDDITLIDEECGLGTSDEEETYDSAEVINNSEDGVLPIVGMQFEIAGDVKSFYKQHAIKCHFGVQICMCPKSRQN